MKKLFMALCAAMFVFACTPAPVPSNNSGTENPGGGSGSGSGSGSGNTPKPVSMVVTTGEASDITNTSALLSGRYESDETDARDHGFYWGTSEAQLSQVLSLNSNNNTTAHFTATLSSLEPNTTYYFQAYVTVWDASRDQYTDFEGQVKSFTTTGSGDTPGPGPDPVVGDQPGWAELPALSYTHYTENSLDYYRLDARQELYLTHHRAQDKQGKVVRNYTACWNSTYKCPEWVAAPRHTCFEGGTSSSRNYDWNPQMPKSVQYTKTSGSGTYNRGHMLGAAERSGCKNGNPSMFDQVNYITNIAPQNASWFNTGSGGWNILEDWVDKQVCNDTLYIVTGCYFETYTDAYGNTSYKEVISENYMGTSNVQKPTMQYYVLLRTKGGNTGKNVANCSASELKCVALVRAHASGIGGQAVTSSEMMSVAALEQITGFTYFANVPNAPKDSFTASDWKW